MGEEGALKKKLKWIGKMVVKGRRKSVKYPACWCGKFAVNQVCDAVGEAARILKVLASIAGRNCIVSRVDEETGSGGFAV